MIPPESETAALMRLKMGVQLGLVIGQTNTSPSLTVVSSSGPENDRAGPCATPGEAATPWRTFSEPSRGVCQRSSVSFVIPHN